MPHTSATTAAVEFKGSTQALMSLRILDPNPEMIDAALKETTSQAPEFFRNAPVVLDLSSLDEHSQIDLPAVLSTVRGRNLFAVAARGVDMQRREQLLELGLPSLSATRETAARPDGKRTENQTTQSRSSEDSEERSGGCAAPQVHVRQVRSGQQVYARDTDLVLLAGSGPGSEILADGNIHVYGTLRGRALCGVGGNTGARIFCQRLEAELVSVAGTYMLCDDNDLDAFGGPAQVRLEGATLRIEPFPTTDRSTS